MSDSRAYLTDFRPRYRPPSAADLCTPVPCMTTRQTNEEVLEVFSRHRGLIALPVVEDGRPIGLINRNIFLSQMSKQFRLELYGRKSCIAFMDKEPLVVDAGMDIDTLTIRTVECGEKALSDGFIITREGAFAGVGSGLQLMRVVADVQASRHRQIMHSIEYASVIQQSTLRTSRDALARVCPQAHLVWEPRDVVGGDFYQFSQGDGGWFGAVADCTGHGVPGAFMTLIASTSLAQAIDRQGAADPARLLGSVNRAIKQVLGQIEGGDGAPGSNDGMDAAFFWIDTAAQQLVFAGARLSLYVLRPASDTVDVIEGQRQGVGYVDSATDYAWQNHAVALPGGSLVFIATDGLTDQVGGPRAIALGKRRIRDLLLQHRSASPAEINRAVQEGLQAWQGEHSRRDDVTFLAFRC